MYRDMIGSTHVLASPEIAVVAIPWDERVWVPQAPDVWFRPLMLNTRQGSGAICCACDAPACCRGICIPIRCMAS